MTVLTVSLQARGQDCVVSVLTCEPGEVVYEQYGHTALRVGDWVFNYGCFDYTAPGFNLRFALGQTDYMLCAEPFSLFLARYREQGRKVWSQEIELTEQQKAGLIMKLVATALPENCTYRYNYLRNNCTTQVRDVIESVTHSTIVGHTTGHTFRSLMHEHNRCYSWSRLSIDLCLGATMDTLITGREAQFAPLVLMRDLELSGCKAELLCNPAGSQEDGEISSQEGGDEPCDCPIADLCVVALSAGMLLIERRTPPIAFISAGVIGCLIAFLFFFSEHPGTGSNLLVLAFNPLPLLLCWWRNKWLLAAYTVLCGAAVLITSVFDLQDVPLCLEVFLITLCITSALHTWRCWRRC